MIIALQDLGKSAYTSLIPAIVTFEEKNELLQRLFSGKNTADKQQNICITTKVHKKGIYNKDLYDIIGYLSEKKI
jgi:hypothetical protein